jgi:hypothetical protein
MTIDEKLAQLKNYRTRYEVILTNGTETFLVQYTSAHSQVGLRRTYSARRAAIHQITKDFIPFQAKTGEVFHGKEWRMLFSGRTQREAILTGELPFASTPAQ